MLSIDLNAGHSAVVGRRGRPAEHTTVQEDFTASCEAGLTEAELVEEHGLSVHQVRQATPASRRFGALKRRRRRECRRGFRRDRRRRRS